MGALTLESLAAEVAALKARLVSLEKGRTQKAELPEVDIDGERGNPVVRKSPPRWKGEDCAGRHYSECPPDFLRSLAGFLQWKAGKNEAEGKEKYAGYDRLDAARALAWAKRLEVEASRYGRSGGGSVKHSAPPEVDIEGDGEADVWASAGDSDVPF